MTRWTIVDIYGSLILPSARTLPVVIDELYITLNSNYWKFITSGRRCHVMLIKILFVAIPGWLYKVKAGDWNFLLDNKD